jgi:peptidoglycan-associated lipoprotein
MTIVRSLVPVVAALAFAAGCADTKAAGKGAASPSFLEKVAAPPVETTGGALPGASALETPSLRVSDELARLCNLPKADAAPQYSPNFAYDSDAIVDQDRAVLAALAHCLSDGALKGRGVSLTGRADPRGEPEYNMSLGESRADSVRRYLHDLGVQAERMRATSRGELDATGTDEASWAHDRRVDIDLAD